MINLKQLAIICSLVLMALACSTPKYVPEVEDINTSTFGAAISLRRYSKSALVEGELIASDSIKTLVLRHDRRYGNEVIEVETDNIKWFNLRYAEPKKYGWSIPVFTLFSLSHGLAAVFSLPFNLIYTSSVVASGENAFTYSNKDFPIQKLNTFSRFPQGLPNNVSYEMIEETTYESNSKFEYATDAGRNGGFEIEENNVPVNWFFYNTDFTLNSNLYSSPRKSAEGDIAMVILAQPALAEAKRPLIAQFVDVEPNTKYVFSFQAINIGLKLVLKAGNPLNELGPEYSLETEEKENEWKTYFLEIETGPEQTTLLIEFSTLKDGRAYLDDTQLEIASAQ